MAWFGLTLYGHNDPFKDMIRPDYKEPYAPPTEPEPYVRVRPEFQCDSGPPDGYAYGSNRRLMALRKKAIFKRVGPYDMYRYPGCNSMVVGWLTEDPVLIGERWHRPRDKFPLPSSEITRDKYVRM